MVHSGHFGQVNIQILYCGFVLDLSHVGLGFCQVVKKFYCNNKTQQNSSRREELFICCETTKHTTCFVFFCAGEIFTTLVDSTVSENKIHSFSGLSIKRTEKKAHPNHKSAINTCRLSWPPANIARFISSRNTDSLQNKIIIQQQKQQKCKNYPQTTPSTIIWD